MLEAKDQALGLYENMKAKQAQFAAKEKEYEDWLNRISVELEAKSASELSLIEVLQHMQL